MKPLRAYLVGAGASAALIAAALAAFLSMTTLVSRTTLPGEGSTAPGLEIATVEVEPLDVIGDGPSPPRSAAAQLLPVLAVAALPVPASQPPANGAVSKGGRENGAGGSSSPIDSARGSQAKRPGVAPTGGGSPAAAQAPTRVRPGLATKPGGLPPGLAKKPGGLPPGLAKKGKVPPGHARNHG